MSSVKIILFNQKFADICPCKILSNWTLNYLKTIIFTITLKLPLNKDFWIEKMLLIIIKNKTRFKNHSVILKVEKILKGSLDSITSPSPSAKNQIMDGKVFLRCKGKTLLVIVNKLLKTKSLLTSPSNVLLYYLKKLSRP